MRKILSIIPLLLLTVAAMACPVCERNKPKLLQGITTHGSTPDSNWDYVIVIVVTIIAIATFYYSFKWLLRPGEKDKAHIKYSFLKDQ